MPQKEIKQPPSGWGSNTKTDGIPRSKTKTFSVWMKKKLKVSHLKDRKQRLLPAERYSEIRVFFPVSFLGRFHNQIMN